MNKYTWMFITYLLVLLFVIAAFKTFLPAKGQDRSGLFACYRLCEEKARAERLPRSWFEACVRGCDRMYRE